ncbi:MAG: hypothetical protein AAFY71_26935 [Bacteroidota bacterium]
MLTKTISLISLLLVLHMQGFAGDSIRFNGMLNGMPYIMTSEGIHFSSLPSDKKELGLILDWSTTNPEMDIYLMDDDFNYLPLEGSASQAIQEHKQAVVFEHVYANIDLIVHPPQNGSLTYEFVVYPGGDPSQIQLSSSSFVSKKKGERVFSIHNLNASQDVAGMDQQEIEINMKEANGHVNMKTASYEVAQALTISFELQVGSMLVGK